MNKEDLRDYVDSVVAPSATSESVEGFFTRKEYPPLTPIERALESLVDRMMEACDDKSDDKVESVEASFSGELHGLLDSLPDEALGDERYWTYLAARVFWRFVRVRQRNAWEAARGEPRNPELPESEKQKLERYLLGKDHYQLPLRMYLRGQAIRDGEDYSLASVEGTDFWRSQVLGVRTCVYPPLARSVVRRQSETELSVTDQRPPGRKVNRLRANIEFARLNDDEAMDLVEPLWVAPPPGTEPKKKAAKKA